MGRRIERPRADARGEFGLIARFLAPLARDVPGAFGLLDDAATLSVPAGHELVVTTDALVAGVHFLPDDPPDLIARKLLRVNLSDLAAKGAKSFAYAMMLALPARDDRFLAAFARGLKTDQDRFGIRLIGGDTVRMPGPLTLSVTMFGLVRKGMMIRRDAAKPGDLVCVTGNIGDAGIGLACLQHRAAGMSAADRKHFVSRYHVPEPRVDFGRALSGIAHAAMDVSDGLAADLAKLCSASCVGAVLRMGDIPLSPALARLVQKAVGLRKDAMVAGDDYEILFAVAPSRIEQVLAVSRRTGVRVTIIGEVTKRRGLSVVDEAGRRVRPGRSGFEHF